MPEQKQRKKSVGGVVGGVAAGSSTGERLTLHGAVQLLLRLPWKLKTFDFDWYGTIHCEYEQTKRLSNILEPSNNMRKTTATGDDRDRTLATRVRVKNVADLAPTTWLRHHGSTETKV